MALAQKLLQSGIHLSYFIGFGVVVIIVVVVVVVVVVVFVVVDVFVIFV